MNSWWMSEYPSSSQNPLLGQNGNFGGRPFPGMWSVTPPSQMPWSSAPVSRFTGSDEDILTHTLSSHDSYATVGRPTKRRVDTAFRGPAQKQLITEERMSETLKALSLHERDEEDWLKPPPIPEGPKLILSEEVKKFQEKEEEILPRSLLQSLDRPANALVLWKPPGGDIRELISVHRLQRDDVRRQEMDDSQAENNNSVMPDFNVMPDQNQVRPPLQRVASEEEMAD